MQNTFADFQDRCNEIMKFLEIVKFAEQGELNITSKPNQPIDPRPTTQQITTLKASCFLILYNLVESTIKNAIQEIYDHLHSQCISFDSLNNETRIQILKNISQRSAPKLVHHIKHIATDSILAPFDKDDIFSGNVDAKSIRDKLNTYGIKQRKTKCSDLLTIKTNRNNLAHGNITFSNCGKDYTSKQLFDMFDNVSKYMKSLLDDVENHIKQQKYL